MEINEKLMNIQSELVANKGQYNSFGKYKYRSAEDIVESVKPLLSKYGLIMLMSDSLENIGDRYYVKSIVTLVCTTSGKEISTNGYAREEENKKGMDGSQITGSSSSYARKYALNGMFAIDDSKDSDSKSEDYGREVTKQEYQQEVTKKLEELTKSKTVGNGSRDKVLEVIKMSGEQFNDMYTKNPKELIDKMSKFK